MDKHEAYAGLISALKTYTGQKTFADIAPSEYPISPSEVANRVISGLHISGTAIPLVAGRSTGVFTLEIPQGISGTIGEIGTIVGRMEAVIKQQTFVTGVMNSYVGVLVGRHIPTMRTIIQQVIEKNVYSTPARITRYGANAKQGEGHTSMDKYIRTYNMLYAFMSGFQHYASGVKFELNSDLAPYWLYVEEGHQVILPDGTEPGIFVNPRHFVDEYKDKLNMYIDSVVIPQISTYMNAVRDMLGAWTLWGNSYTQFAGNYSVKNYPSMYEITIGDYRSNQFYESVGAM
jgi:hypothetical protein